jgi:hypothetical protein
MKAAINKLTGPAAIPAFYETLHRVRTRPMGDLQHPASQKRDNVFSKSRDAHEDRGARQMKTSRNAQAFPHVR